MRLEVELPEIMQVIADKVNEGQIRLLCLASHTSNSSYRGSTSDIYTAFSVSWLFFIGRLRSSMAYFLPPFTRAEIHPENFKVKRGEDLKIEKFLLTTGMTGDMIK